MQEYKCKLCEKEFETYSSLQRHSRRTHDIKVDKFYVDFHLNGIYPLCECGCGEKTKWSPILKNFRKYKMGHYSRVHNNWGHNKNAIERSAETRRQQYKSGERTTWCKGLSVLTDPRLQQQAKTLSARYTPEIKKEYSDRMRKMRLDGTVPTLHGKDHSQWKGGVAPVNAMARSDVRLYKEWKYPILIKDGFKCTNCGDTKDLHVHHDKETFSEIIKKCITLEEYDMITDFDTKTRIVEKITNYHIDNKVSGITLCHKCHGELHPSLNL